MEEEEEKLPGFMQVGQEIVFPFFALRRFTRYAKVFPPMPHFCF
jgi:hypothetical protein